MPPSSTKIYGAPRATVSAASVAPNISTYHSAEARGSSLMMWTWSNLNAELLIADLHRPPCVTLGAARSPGFFDQLLERLIGLSADDAISIRDKGRHAGDAVAVRFRPV